MKTKTEKYNSVRTDVEKLSFNSTWEDIFKTIDIIESLGDGYIFHFAINQSHTDIRFGGASNDSDKELYYAP